MFYCDKVSASCPPGVDTELDEFSVVKKGDRVGRCVVVSASPNPCIYYSHVSRLSVLHTAEIAVLATVHDWQIVKIGGGVYMYPSSVVELIKRSIFEPLARGEHPVRKKLLLVGPPGTGKTTLMKIVAQSLGVHTVVIEPHEVMSKWLGETEQNLSKKFEEAFENEPSVVIADDADFLITTRSFSGSQEHGDWVYSTRRVMFNYIDRIDRENRLVVVMAATNLGVQAIDPAIRRGGRFGEPVVIPPPTTDVYVEWLRHSEYPWLRRLVEEKGFDHVARKVSMLAARGLSPADIIHTLMMYQTTGVFSPPPAESGLGFAWLGFPMSVRELIEYAGDERTKVVETVANNVKPYLEGRGKVKVRLKPNLTDAPRYVNVIAAVLAAAVNYLGYRLVKLTNAAKVADAITMIQMFQRACIFVDTPIIAEKAALELLNASVPVFFVYPPPQVANVLPTAVLWTDSARSAEFNRIATYILSAFYGAKVEGKVLNLTDDQLRKTANVLANTWGEVGISDALIRYAELYGAAD